MKILAIADEEDKGLWDFFSPDRVKDVDLIISCGDLNHNYLEFLESMANVPLLYVSGNHDGGYGQRPPEGCECIDDRIYNFHGLRILGLGGSMRYKPGPCMYTEQEMKSRIGHSCCRHRPMSLSILWTMWNMMRRIHHASPM